MKLCNSICNICSHKPNVHRRNYSPVISSCSIIDVKPPLIPFVLARINTKSRQRVISVFSLALSYVVEYCSKKKNSMLMFDVS